MKGPWCLEVKLDERRQLFYVARLTMTVRCLVEDMALRPSVSLSTFHTHTYIHIVMLYIHIIHTYIHTIHTYIHTYM